MISMSYWMTSNITSDVSEQLAIIVRSNEGFSVDKVSCHFSLDKIWQDLFCFGADFT